MCLIVLDWQPGSDPSLRVAANRDEFHHRPTAPLQVWPDAPQVMAGRDLASGGTWLGVSTDGRFAALTNYRDPARQQPDARSRGALVADFLTGQMPAAEHAATCVREASQYNGFNLLLCDGRDLIWVGHGGGHAPRSALLQPGLHALSNHLPGTPWPKLVRAREAFARVTGETSGATTDVQVNALFELLLDRTPAADTDLPDTGVSLDWERRLSPVFIAGDDYGTRSRTVLMLGTQVLHMEERRHGAGGVEAGRTILSRRTARRKPDAGD